VICALAEAQQQQDVGKKFVVDNNLVDPAPMIASAVARVVAAEHGGYVTDAPIAGAKKIDDLKTVARYVVGVDTFSWGAIYYALDWSHVHLTLITRLRVIDTQTNKIVFKDTCNHKGVRADDSMAPADLRANSAAEVKRRTALAVAECVAKFTADITQPAAPTS
jgi:hypothetical protein